MARPRKDQDDSARREQALALRRDGMSIKQIAAHLHAGVLLVRRWVVAAGMPVETPQRKPLDEAAVIAYCRTHPVMDARRHFGVHVDQITKILDAAGVERVRKARRADYRLPAAQPSDHGSAHQERDRAVMATVVPGEPRTCRCGSVLQDPERTICRRCQ